MTGNLLDERIAARELQSHGRDDMSAWDQRTSVGARKSSVTRGMDAGMQGGVGGKVVGLTRRASRRRHGSDVCWNQSGPYQLRTLGRFPPCVPLGLVICGMRFSDLCVPISHV